MVEMNRRDFLLASGGLAVAGTALRAGSGAETTPAGNGTLAPWQAGFLDIHHIHTGRGNSTLVIAPDGTSLLVDAGASSTEGAAMDEARPSGELRPGEWIARYAARQLRATGRPGLDYALMTHLHGDHVGDVSAKSPQSKNGSYKLTGISDLVEAMPAGSLGKLIDRGYPDYNYPAPMEDATSKNYMAFAKSMANRGTPVERCAVGSLDQIGLKYDRQRYANYAARVIAGNGEVWTGHGEEKRARFPSQTGVPRTEQVSENSCSIALRLSYGDFSYFTGGDLNSDTNYGRDPWRDIETPAAQAAGPVSVATCTHHGYFDATGPGYVTALRPRVWIIQSWHASHPAISVLANLYSPLVYSGERDVFSLGLHPAAGLVCGRFSDHLRSSQGHVLVRVSPGGAEYRVIVLDDGDESDSVKTTLGPYAPGS
jgi:beta-lactamase superfamily II metal-dependent hydrolase